jgi:tRNA pseudouridine32 synthase/23S rRNA pseudouridine746 synthase
MSAIKSRFFPFEQSISIVELPERFTFPYFYTPHPLCLQAAEELQQYLLEHFNANLPDSLDSTSLRSDQSTSQQKGKMFGVLLVKNNVNEVGYLAAYSGKSTTLDALQTFVPAISNKYECDSYFTDEQKNINNLTVQLNVLESNPQLADYQIQLNELQHEFSTDLTKQQLINAENRKRRKAERLLATQILNTEALTDKLSTLAAQSVNDKNTTLALKAKWQAKVQIIEAKLSALTNGINDLITERQQRSTALQGKLFEHYNVLNSNGQTKSLIDIFKPTPQHIPPSGAGDCAAPKLLQYAFQHNFTPLAMAEFWWGASPKSEIRQHKNYYPACMGKCEPILNWMLEGIAVDNNPLLKSNTNGKDIEIVYQDNAMAIINKPSGYLSVPGKHIQHSVQTRIQELIPTASGPIIVHRLDMCTSGLMVIALTKRAHKALQKQFISRTVNKRYIALLEGRIDNQLNVSTKGYITLPLRGDLHDRPRQLVCETNGKPAETFWEIIDTIHTEDNKSFTKVYLSPKTGRTHQLRVHCAHHLGLNTPIVGDDLYGKSAARLHLHAEKIELDHPITRERLYFQVDADF